MLYDGQMKTARIAKNDPRYEYKKKALAALEFTFPESGGVDLYDISGIAEPDDALLADAGANGAYVLRTEPLTMRHWAFAEAVRKFDREQMAGELISFRIFFNMPKSRGWSAEEFRNGILPRLADLAEFIGGRKALRIQVNHVPGMNHAFMLIELENKVVAEIECHDSLPARMEPMRFIHAYFKNGAISNLPLAGFYNMEGILQACDDGTASRPVIENVCWDEFDEVDNFYFRTLAAIRNHQPEEPVYTEQSVWRSVIGKALETFDPVEVRA